MSVTTLIAAVRRRTGLSSSDAFAADADITELLNEVASSIAAERDWPWLETSATLSTSAGTATYSPPADWMRTRSLQIPGYQPLDGKNSRAQLDEWMPTSTSTGMPVHWTVSGDLIRLYPTPDAVYAISHVYYRTETTLDDGADNPLMPAWAQGALIWGAAAILFARTNQEARAGEAQKRADAWLRRLGDNARRSAGGGRVQVRPGSPV